MTKGADILAAVKDVKMRLEESHGDSENDSNDEEDEIDLKLLSQQIGAPKPRNIQMVKDSTVFEHPRAPLHLFDRHSKIKSFVRASKIARDIDTQPHAEHHAYEGSIKLAKQLSFYLAFLNE